MPTQKSTYRALQPLAMLACLVVAGCASSPGTHSDLRDPWEIWNRNVQTFNDNLDNYFMKPVAQGYHWITPTVVDKGITNFYSNADDITVTLNDVLQMKFEQAGMDASRFMVNTVLGFAGVYDVASQMYLPKHNEDFDQTLAIWGMPSGPYVVMPFLGPTTPRGILGTAGDAATNPVNYVGQAGISMGFGGLKMVDFRADNLSTSKIADEASLDRYEFIRNAYFQQRDYAIHDGNPPAQDGLQEEIEHELDESMK